MAFVKSIIAPTPEEFESIQFWFGLMHKHEVQFPSEGSMIYQPPTGKVGYVRIWFLCSRLNPNDVKKIVGFELGFRALGVLHHLQAIQSFFNSSTHSGVHTFSQCCNRNSFIFNQKEPQKNWHDRWLCVNSDLVRTGYPCVPKASDRFHQLLEVSLSVARMLIGICVLAAVGMSADWRSHGKMPQFFVDNDGK
ncbi:unnamed protein product [Lactuca saligna]|uniref:Uncharacterized protein n=1 Tax=Lactuca saligna TaxID=75948 RepID=A0AA36E5S4_LACSI|nr:unnamed protein product [Lactuca saligna]